MAVGLYVGGTLAVFGLLLFVDWLLNIGQRPDCDVAPDVRPWDATLDKRSWHVNRAWLLGLLLLLVIGPSALVASLAGPSVVVALVSLELGLFFFVYGLVRVVVRAWKRPAPDQRTGYVHRMWAGGLLLIVVVCPASLVIGALIPELCLPRVARHGDQIVSALRRFESDHDRPPRELQELVPVYIDDLPWTGYVGLAYWEYARNEEGWTLCAAIADSPLDFDEYRYSPDKEPGSGYRWKRDGDWLYLND